MRLLNFKLKCRFESGEREAKRRFDFVCFWWSDWAFSKLLSYSSLGFCIWEFSNLLSCPGLALAIAHRFGQGMIGRNLADVCHLVEHLDSGPGQFGTLCVRVCSSCLWPFHHRFCQLLSSCHRLRFTFLHFGLLSNWSIYSSLSYPLPLIYRELTEIRPLSSSHLNRIFYNQSSLSPPVSMCKHTKNCGLCPLKETSQQRNCNPLKSHFTFWWTF